MTVSPPLVAYAAALFAPEDVVLREIRTLHQAEGLPDIAISADEGKILLVLLRAIGAQRVLEIGTLGGYSGVWLARGLAPGGRLTTVEADPRHAAVARRAFELAGVAERVELIEGRGLDVLARLDGPYDAIFLDADKEPLEQYFHRSLELLRVGGLLLCDNAFCNGRVTDLADQAPDVNGVRAYNRRAAGDPRLVSTVIPVRDGLVVSLKVAP